MEVDPVLHCLQPLHAYVSFTKTLTNFLSFAILYALLTVQYYLPLSPNSSIYQIYDFGQVNLIFEPSSLIEIYPFSIVSIKIKGGEKPNITQRVGKIILIYTTYKQLSYFALHFYSYIAQQLFRLCYSILSVSFSHVLPPNLMIK